MLNLLLTEQIKMKASIRGRKQDYKSFLKLLNVEGTCVCDSVVYFKQNLFGKKQQEAFLTNSILFVLLKQQFCAGDQDSRKQFFLLRTDKRLPSYSLFCENEQLTFLV